MVIRRLISGSCGGPRGQKMSSSGSAGRHASPPGQLWFPLLHPGDGLVCLSANRRRSLPVVSSSETKSPRPHTAPAAGRRQWNSSGKAADVAGGHCPSPGSADASTALRLQAGSPLGELAQRSVLFSSGHPARFSLRGVNSSWVVPHRKCAVEFSKDRKTGGAATDCRSRREGRGLTYNLCRLGYIAREGITTQMLPEARLLSHTNPGFWWILVKSNRLAWQKGQLAAATFDQGAPPLPCCHVLPRFLKEAGNQGFRRNASIFLISGKEIKLNTPLNRFLC
ncbi:uncharacterized protein LOC125104526 [Lutra lutra]|uniref:uncharacterized protein LOC125104526 n=1 Tax=Lutra lutra TaxID=9657 RepID=UPI001FD5FBD5|nr:uncharacterized protein LOC125104526 [Lutra lutra]